MGPGSAAQRFTPRVPDHVPHLRPEILHGAEVEVHVSEVEIHHAKVLVMTVPVFAGIRAKEVLAG